MNAPRDDLVDFLTTHRHGEKKEACTYCATYYGELIAKVEPLIREQIARRILNTVDPLGEGAQVRMACVRIVRGGVA